MVPGRVGPATTNLHVALAPFFNVKHVLHTFFVCVLQTARHISFPIYLGKRVVALLLPVEYVL